MNPPPEALRRLQEVFGKYPEVAAVYLFGSRAKGGAQATSDYDLAVVPNRGGAAQPRKVDILADLVRTGFDNVDLVVLDGTKPVLEHEAVRLNRVIFRRPDFDSGTYFSRVMRMYFDALPLLAVQRRALKGRFLRGMA